MRPETEELINRLTPDQRTDLLAGLSRKYQKDTAHDALAVIELLGSHLITLGLHEHIDHLAAMRRKVREFATY